MKTLVSVLFLSLMTLCGNSFAQKAHTFQIPKPAEAHQVLTNEAGVWDTDVKLFFQGPNQPPVVYKGAETSEMVSAGLYLKMSARGKLGDQEFEGHGLLGYDARTKEYIGTWVDNLTSTPTQTRGTYDAERKTLTLFSAVVDGAGREIQQKQVTHFVDDKTKTVTTFMLIDAESKKIEIKLMEITARKK